MTIDTLDQMHPECLELQLLTWSPIRLLADWLGARMGQRLSRRAISLRFEWGGGLSAKLFRSSSSAGLVWQRVTPSGLWFVAGHTFVFTSAGTYFSPASHGLAGRLRLLARHFEREDQARTPALSFWEGLNVLR